jgi:hypothetical protein
MKKSIYIFSFLLSVIFICSCKDKKVVIPAPQVNEFQIGLNNQDTLEMLQLCDNCMEQLKAGDIDGVVSNLYEYDDSMKSVSLIGDEAEFRFRRQLQVFPVLDYKRVSYKFFDEGLNDVKYEIVFAEEKNPEVNGVPKTFFMFNPVKVDGKWYLCVKQRDQRVNGE